MFQSSLRAPLTRCTSSVVPDAQPHVQTVQANVYVVILHLMMDVCLPATAIHP